VPAGAPVGARMRAALARMGVKARLRDTGKRVRHVITHRSIEVEVWSGTLKAKGRAGPGRWVDPCDPRVGLTALAARLARASRNHHQPPAGAARTRRR